MDQKPDVSCVRRRQLTVTIVPFALELGHILLDGSVELRLSAQGKGHRSSPPESPCGGSCAAGSDRGRLVPTHSNVCHLASAAVRFKNVAHLMAHDRHDERQGVERAVRTAENKLDALAVVGVQANPLVGQLLLHQALPTTLLCLASSSVMHCMYRCWKMGLVWAAAT